MRMQSGQWLGLSIYCIYILFYLSSEWFRKLFLTSSIILKILCKMVQPIKSCFWMKWDYSHRDWSMVSELLKVVYQPNQLFSGGLCLQGQGSIEQHG
jgi:hypothetical protein